LRFLPEVTVCGHLDASATSAKRADPSGAQIASFDDGVRCIERSRKIESGIDMA